MKPGRWRLKEMTAWPQPASAVMVVARKDFDPQSFDPKAKLLDLVKDLTCWPWSHRRSAA